MESYPLFFDFKLVIKGGDFYALIEAKGKALMRKEDGKWWIFGVQPGGMAASGVTIEESKTNFQQTFKYVLEDIVSDAESGNKFKTMARDFFNSINKEEFKEWQTARKGIRSEKTMCPDNIGKLKRETSDLSCSIDILVIRKQDRPKIKKSDIISETDLFACAA